VTNSDGGGTDAVDEEELTKLFGAGPGGRMQRLSIPPRGCSSAAAAAAVAAAELLAEAADESLGGSASAAELALPSTPSAAAATPTVGGGAGAGGMSRQQALGLEVAGLNLGSDRVPKLYCVLVSLHGLVRGERMELGRDADTGGQVCVLWGGERVCFGGA